MRKLISVDWSLNNLLLSILLLVLAEGNSFAQPFLKFIVYDFEGIAAGSTDLPEGDYKYGDITYQTVPTNLNSRILENTCLKVHVQPSAGYGAFGKGLSRFISLNVSKDKLCFYILNPSTSALTLKVRIQDDDNNDGTFKATDDDVWSTPMTVSQSASWQLIQLPLNIFKDENSGGDGGFNIGPDSNLGMMHALEFRMDNLSGPSFDFYVDMICFAEGNFRCSPDLLSFVDQGNGCLTGAYGENSQNAPENVPSELYGLFQRKDRKIKYVNTFLAFSNSSTTPDNFPGAGIKTLLNEGYTPIITIEPFYSQLAPLDPAQPRLADITSGKFDSYLRLLAQKVKSYDDTLIIRPMHEFDGNWYPWCISVNGGDPALYASAFRHIVDVFRSEGARKVKWLWCPNSSPAPQAVYNSFLKAWPGYSYVDITGTNIYNHPFSGTPYWRTFRQLLTETYFLIRTSFPDKPFIVCETGCRELAAGERLPETKADWIGDMSRDLKELFPETQGMIWFNKKKEHDWEIASSMASQQAFEDHIWNDDYFFQILTAMNVSKNFNTSIFPNPAENKIQILFDAQNVKMLIMDLQGKILMCSSLISGTSLDISILRPGMYIMELSSENRISRSKFVKL